MKFTDWDEAALETSRPAKPKHVISTLRRQFVLYSERNTVNRITFANGPLR